LSESIPAGAAPRYQQIAEALIRDIERSRYAVGALLPPEPALSQHYGVSRHTVREAIRRLADMGLVSRQQGIGTRVKAKSAAQRYVAGLSDLAELMQYTQRTTLKLIGERRLQADAALASLLRCRAGQPWIEFETCRYPAAGREPISHTRIYVLPEYEGIRDELKGSVWVYGLIEKRGGEKIVEVQQEIGGAAIPAHAARLLQVKPRSPGMMVTRYYLGRRERLLSVSVNYYPENRFKLSTRWRLEWDGAKA